MLTRKCTRCAGPIWLDAVTEAGCGGLDWWVTCGACGEILGVIDRRGALTPYETRVATETPIAPYRLH